VNAPSNLLEGDMFKKLGLLGFVLTAFGMVFPSVAQPLIVTHPRGFYFHGGRWRPYHGRGYPYRGGFYDRWGRWHRFR
jgi:hypothetical protein